MAIDQGQSPAEELIWKEYLSWLCGRRSDGSPIVNAFLLHAEVLRDLELLAIASIRSIAAAR